MASDTVPETEQLKPDPIFGVIDSIVGAGFDALVAWTWPKPDGTLVKRPGHPNGHLDAHRDKQLLYRQALDPPWRPSDAPPDAAVVVAFVPGSGGCGVLDCDAKGGAPGLTELQHMIDEHGDFVTHAWQSPSGGMNVLWSKPPDTEFGNRSPWPGIDVRADAGWVVAPGCSTQWGAWTYKRGDFTTKPGTLPAPLLAGLATNVHHGPRAGNAEARRFIEASPTNSAPNATFAFSEQLERLRRAPRGSRHATLMGTVAWVCGMTQLDQRGALRAVQSAWDVLTQGEGRGDEVLDCVTWAVGQEQVKRAAQPTNGHSPPAGGPDIQMSAPPIITFREIPDPFVIPPVTWHAEQFLCRGTHGELSGPEKSLKSYLGLALDIGLAAGLDVLGRFTVTERQRVLVLVGEGGEMPFLRRVAEVCYGYGIRPADLRGWLNYSVDHARIGSFRFNDGLRIALDSFGPALVHADPWYVYQPSGLEASQLGSVGEALDGLAELCRSFDATALINHHHNRTGQEGLRQISGAGHAEWVDSWFLTGHRAEPDLVTGNYRLTLEVGSRQWGGGLYDVDLTLTPMLGQARWSVTVAAPAGSAPPTDPLAVVKVDLLRIGRQARKPLARQDWLARLGGRRTAAISAFDELLDTGTIRPVSTVQRGTKTVDTFEVTP